MLSVGLLGNKQEAGRRGDGVNTMGQVVSMPAAALMKPTETFKAGEGGRGETG
jgi:hypothetical protein